MDPRLKEDKLQNIWIECTLAKSEDDLDWCQYVGTEKFAINSNQILCRVSFRKQRQDQRPR